MTMINVTLTKLFPYIYIYKTYTEGVSEQGAEENIWNQEGCSGKRLEKTS
jgi:hypothetical protein